MDPIRWIRGGPLTSTAMRKAPVLAMLVLVLAGCSTPAPAPGAPSAEAARSFLDRVFAVATTGSVESLCDLGSGTCAHDLRSAGVGTRPSAPPRVMGSWVVPSAPANGGAATAAGRAFALCGTDGLGRGYYSEVLIFDDGGRGLRAVNAVFWLGTRLATTATVNGGSPPPARYQCS